MSGRGSKNHIHKYRRIELAGQKVWSCALSDCTHYMPKHMEAFVEGKVSICWGCDKNLVMDIDRMKYDNPICLECEIKAMGMSLPFDDITQGVP